MAIFELIGEFALAFGLEVFQNNLEAVFLTYLTNTAASVRKMGVQKTGQLAASFGESWVIEHLIPKVVESYSID